MLIVSKFLRTGPICALSALAALAAPSAVAQGLEIAPIAFDVDETDDSQLVVASLSVDDSTSIVSTGLQAGPQPLSLSVRAQLGLPDPSIILGLIEAGTEASYGIERLMPSTVEQISFAPDDLEARAALRDSDRDLFVQLVGEGHLDPSAGDLNRQLQIELQRMNCYRSGIDGAWGPGSRRSVGAYFDELASVNWSDQEPSNELYRAILINGDVECEVPVAAAPAAPRQTTTTTTRQPARQTQTQRQQPAQQTQSAPAPSLQGLSLGAGVTQ